jgi:hypothetical protein
VVERRRIDGLVGTKESAHLDADVSVLSHVNLTARADEPRQIRWQSRAQTCVE